MRQQNIIRMTKPHMFDLVLKNTTGLRKCCAYAHTALGVQNNSRLGGELSTEASPGGPALVSIGFPLGSVRSLRHPVNLLLVALHHIINVVLQPGTPS